MRPGLGVLERVPFSGAAQQDICAGRARERGSWLSVAMPVKRRRKFRATACRLGLRDNHASSAVLRDCLGPPHPLVWVRAPFKEHSPQEQISPERNPMARLKFGAFLAPHHPIGEHPMLQSRRDLDGAEHLDALGYNESWRGEHPSPAWETTPPPKMSLPAAADPPNGKKPGPGVISLPY